MRRHWSIWQPVRPTQAKLGLSTHALRHCWPNGHKKQVDLFFTFPPIIFFPAQNGTAHSETDQVTLVNEYARTKFAGEAMALTSPHALVLRTSIVGIRGGQPLSAAEWAIQAVSNDEEMTLFHDAWTSSIDTPSFAEGRLRPVFLNTIHAWFDEPCGRRSLFKGGRSFVRLHRNWVAHYRARPPAVSTMSCLGVRPAWGLMSHTLRRYSRIDLPVLPQVVTNIIKQAGL